MRKKEGFKRSKKKLGGEREYWGMYKKMGTAQICVEFFVCLVPEEVIQNCHKISGGGLFIVEKKLWHM